MQDTLDHGAAPIVFHLDAALVSEEALLKAAYWFSRDFAIEFHRLEDGKYEVSLTPRPGTHAQALASARYDFLSSCNDFVLRERIESKTAGVRDLLLAKAFSESGVLEEEPRGTFNDAVEGSKQDGMFNILSNHVRV